MYTQCSKCKSVFRVSETQLSVRNGLVRCGQCQEVFNASWNLVDEVPTAVTRQRETQEQDAVGVDAPRASTTDGGAPPPRRPAGGEQVELFGGDLAVKGRPKIQRRKRGAGPGGETELLPSAMPFAIVEDDTVPAERAERPAGSGEPLAEGVVEPVDDGEETAAGAPTEAVDHRPEAGETDEGVLAEVQGETPLDLADTEADIGSAVAGTLEIVESAPEADEPQSGVSPEGKEVDEKARPDEEHVAMDLQPRSAAEAQPDKEEPVTQEPSGHPTPQPDDDEPLLPGSSASAEEEHPALALQPAEVDEPAEEVATEPSLADLFAAAEEQLSQEDEGTANRREVSRSAPIGDLFAVADEAPSEEDDGTASGGEVNTEPAQPQVPEADDAGGGEPDHAEAKAPFDTPDAEEIVIEAPAMLWDAFRDEAPGGSGSDGQDRWDEQEAEADDAAAMAAKPGAATVPQDPHIGYVYPAGGQRGTIAAVRDGRPGCAPATKPRHEAGAPAAAAAAEHRGVDRGCGRARGCGLVAGQVLLSRQPVPGRRAATLCGRLVRCAFMHGSTTQCVQSH